MMTTMPQTNISPLRQHKLADLWRVGMVLLAVGLFSDTAGQVWNNLGTPGWTVQAHVLAAVPALLGGSAGLALTIYAVRQFQKWPQPRFTAYGINKGMDEREVAQLLEAQAKTQSYFVRFTLGLFFIMSAVARNGLYLSWWSCLLGLCLLLNAMIYLPTAILAWTEPDLRDEA